MSVDIRKAPLPFAWVTPIPYSVFHLEARNYASRKLGFAPLGLLMKFHLWLGWEHFYTPHCQPQNTES